MPRPYLRSPSDSAVPALERWVYSFGDGRADGSAAMRDILGGKGAGLAEMANLGLPVPPGFTISAKLCIAYLEHGTFPDDLREEVDRQLKQLERASKKRFGDARDPLLVSVRSGAAVSMPGMMETILNLGLNDETVQGLIAGSKNPRFAYDCYRRFVQMYGDVVFDLGKEPFTEVLDEFKRRRKAQRDIDLPADDLKALAREFKSIIQSKTGLPFPEDPTVQLWGAIAAVFKSWRTRRAVDYRRVHGIPDDLGTAVNVVAMVYGNMGDDSGTVVAFTRDCSTGEAVLNGDVLTNAQGEDVVSGARTPESISTLKRGKLAKVYRELQRIATKLERHFRDVQDIEFTFEHGKLYLLQTRRAQRAGLAAVRTAVEMVEEGLITPGEAVQRVPPQDLDQLFHPMGDPRASVTLVAKGLPASPGAATGEAVFDADEAEALAHEGRKVILIRPETSPEDFHGIVAAQAVLTARGGMTSHAAVVARGMGKTCVVGAKDIEVDPAAGRLRANGRVVKWGQLITVDGTTGRVLLGAAKLVEPKLGSHYAKLMVWADQHRRLGGRANADTRPAPRARQAAPDAARGLRGDVRGDGRSPGHDPPARSAAARVPPAREGRARHARPRYEAARGPAGAARRLAGRGEPDARASRLPARHHVSRDHRNAGAGDFRSGVPCREPRQEGDRRGHDPVGRAGRGAASPDRDRAPSGTGGVPGRGPGRAVSRRDDDRVAARGAHRRRDRQGRGVLLLRNERPHADDLRPLARRRGSVPPVLRGARDPEGRPVSGARPGGRRQAHRAGGSARARIPGRLEDRHLRGARRRAGVGEVLSPRGHELCVLLAVPRAHRPSRRSAGGARRTGRN